MEISYLWWLIFCFFQDITQKKYEAENYQATENLLSVVNLYPDFLYIV